MANRNDGEVMEGYICPNCMKTFSAPNTLLKHFENEHSSETDILKSLQGLFGKAKKKILSLDLDEWSPESSTAGSSTSTVHFYEEKWPNQAIGTSRTHTDTFKTLRHDRYERVCYEINNLIIRLGKLLTDMPTEPVKKKKHEQNIVPWLDGKDVPRCPNCTHSFNFAKRQHHCRLCGCIMCHECSYFIPLNKAKQILVKPDLDQSQRPASSIRSDLSLRVCSYCLQRLESREQLKESRNSRPPICDLHDTLISKKQEASKLRAMYLEMVDSLLAGETTYHASDAQTLRVKLVRLAENIDTISNKITTLSTPPAAQDPPPATSSTAMSMSQRLAKSIRLACTQFIRSQLLTLPNVPSEEKLTDLREQARLAEEQRKREEEIRHLREQSEVRVETHHARHLGAPKENNVALLEAWSPANTKLVSSQDPLVQQISIIKQYITEARVAHRYNEVASLESNLKELQEEYFRRQQESNEETPS
uniref:Rabenosyn-5 n=1 Tax=Cacopsylla melanoneura TaxID=428564 RepID=A0A8D8YMX2_9HEMI